MKSRLASHALCSQGWPWTPDPSTSTSQVLGLHHGFVGFVLCHSLHVSLSPWVLLLPWWVFWSLSVFNYYSYLTNPLTPGPVHSCKTSRENSSDHLACLFSTSYWHSVPQQACKGLYEGWASWPTGFPVGVFFFTVLSNVTVVLHSFSGCFNSPERGSPLACVEVAGGRRWKERSVGSEPLNSVLGCPVFRMQIPLYNGSWCLTLTDLGCWQLCLELRTSCG